MIGKNKMNRVIQKRRIDIDEMQRMDIGRWPTWGKDISSFPWHYDEQETCYLIEGRVTVTPDGGEPIEIVAGELATFPAGLSCRWDIHEPVLKHYRFG